MITDILLTFIFTILDFIFGLLPKVETMPAWYNYFKDSIDIFQALHALPFIGTIVDIAIIVITVLATWQTVVFANWLYNKIRGSG